MLAILDLIGIVAAEGASIAQGSDIKLPFVRHCKRTIGDRRTNVGQTSKGILRMILDLESSQLP